MITIVAGLPVMFLYPTGRERMSAYLTGLNNPLDSSYHIQRSMEAVINGRWFGVGIGQAGTKFTGLPLAPTDSIFAVIAEETGIRVVSNIYTHSLTTSDGPAPSYLEMMRYNTSAIVAALQGN